MLGAGVAVFDGTYGESGLGLALRLALVSPGVNTWLRAAAELTWHRFTALSQKCALSCPGCGCYPADPPAHVLSFRVGLQAAPQRALYLAAGAGRYSHVGRPDENTRTAVGLDAGAGLRLSGRVTMEARYTRLWIHQPCAWLVVLVAARRF
jgi:hypothetical protein